jgi:hypothetical protein
MEVQVGVSPNAWEEEANTLSISSRGCLAKAALQADDGAQVHFFHSGGTVGHDGAYGVGLGGAGGGGLVVGLFDLQGNSGAIHLTFPSTAPAPLSAPLAKGHWCLFTVLCGTNFHPQKSHFQRSCLNAQFLFCASHFFSFWAAVTCLSPLERSKKAMLPSLLRSSKMYTNITFLTFEISHSTSATAHLTRWV